MNSSPPAVLLPQQRHAPALAARYAVYALDELTQLAFGGLADAVASFGARGINVPVALAESRLGDRGAVGLCDAVEQALVDLIRDQGRLDAAAERFHVHRHDVVDALGVDGLTVPGVISSARASRTRTRQLVGLGCDVAFLALLDEIRRRDWTRHDRA